MDLKACPHCGCNHVEIERHNVFDGDYGDKYPVGVRTQRHGFRARCPVCACQTCYWHYEIEAVNAWNTRADEARIRRETIEECSWTEEDPWGSMPDTWQTACGNLFTYTEGGPSENDAKFCCYCGKKLVEIRALAEDGS